MLAMLALVTFLALILAHQFMPATLVLGMACMLALFRILRMRSEHAKTEAATNEAIRKSNAEKRAILNARAHRVSIDEVLKKTAPPAGRPGKR